VSDKIEIYGSIISLPEKPKDEDALYYGLPRNQQKWRRTSLPNYFDKVEYDKNGNLILTHQQEVYASEEVKRCKQGVWAWIGERMRYIPKRYYFYLQYYTLEDGTAPEFREADRLYYLFFEHWFLILWCLGIIRIKKRRQGASSQSCSNILYEAIFFKNSNCGLLSKTKDDSKATFTEMITAAYRLLPVFLKPKQVNKEDSVTELVFAHKSQSVKAGVAAGAKEEEGHNSKINYKAPVLNAYDRGRMSYVLGDEFGKLPLDVPASRLLSIIGKTLVKGVKRVGWIDMPSTVNEMTAGGGAEYKKIWDSADQFNRKPTINRIVRFFQPAYEAYEGFIDEFGDSVVNEPTEEQYEYLVSKWVMKNEEGELISELSEEDIRLGAKVYVLNKLRDGKTGVDLEEEIRMNPCTEEEAFLYAGVGCEFNSINILNQIKWIEDNPNESYLRQNRLVLKKDKIKSVVIGKPDKEKISINAMDDENGGWFIFEYPNDPNKFSDRGGFFEPMNTNMYVIGVDTTSHNEAVNGSKPRALVMKKSCIVDGEETGMKPVAMWLADKRLGVHFDEEIMKAALFYGCKICYEIDYRDDYVIYFTKNGMRSFLEWTPSALRSPTKRNPKIEPGVRSGDSFQHYQQLQIAKAFIDGDSQDVYNGHVHRIVYPSLLNQLLKFNNADRTKSDECISLFMALVTMFGEDNSQKAIAAQKIKVLPQYKIKMVS